MLRSLWTGASGMIAQQTNVDTISNNLANVNTVGYKKETVEFKSLLYQKLQTKTTDNNGDPKPVIGQVGSGVRTGAISSRFIQGNLVASENPFDLAIEGDGFFSLQTPDGETAYTRNGSLLFSIANDGLALTSTDGYPVLSTEGSPIVVDRDTDVAKLTVDQEGRIFLENQVPIVTENQTEEEAIANKKFKTEQVQIAQISLTQFNNPSGLLKISGSMYKETPASGTARLEAEDASLKKSKIHSYRLEASNVQTVDEIVNLIVAQRAYEMNSKVITASDQMLQQANNLRG